MNRKILTFSRYSRSRSYWIMFEKQRQPPMPPKTKIGIMTTRGLQYITKYVMCLLLSVIWAWIMHYLSHYMAQCLSLANLPTAHCARLINYGENICFVHKVIFTWGPFHYYGLRLIQTRMRNYIHCKVWDEITYLSRNGWMISPHTSLRMWLLTYVGIRVNPC